MMMANVGEDDDSSLLLESQYPPDEDTQMEATQTSSQAEVTKGDNPVDTMLTVCGGTQYADTVVNDSQLDIGAGGWETSPAEKAQGLEYIKSSVTYPKQGQTIVKPLSERLFPEDAAEDCAKPLKPAEDCAKGAEDGANEDGAAEDSAKGEKESAKAGAGDAKHASTQDADTDGESDPGDWWQGEYEGDEQWWDEEWELDDEDRAWWDGQCEELDDVDYEWWDEQWEEGDAEGQQYSQQLLAVSCIRYA